MSELTIYQSPEGNVLIDVKFEHEAVWLTQSQMVSLFESSEANISEHVKSIYLSDELNKDSTVRKFRTVQMEGKRQISRDIDHYSLLTW
jgi:hypothetical protein